MPAAEIRAGAVFDFTETRGMHITFDEVSDRAFRTEVRAGPTANGGPLHRHLHQEEHFTVHEGALRMRLGFRGTRVVPAGEEVVVPRGTPHTFTVEGEGAAFTAEFTPPLRVAEYFLELFEVEKPSLRVIARLARAYPREHFYLPVVPPAVQRALLRPFA